MRRISKTEQRLFLAELQKISGLTRTDFKSVEKEAKTVALRYERSVQRKKEKKSIEAEQYELKPSLTMDMHLHRLCFPSGSSIVMNDGFFTYQKQYGYWVSIPDKDVLKKLTQASDTSFRWVGKSHARYKKFLGTSSAANSAIKYSRGMLTLSDTDTPENKHLRAFSNCTVDMRTGVATQHSAQHYLTSAIAAEYNQHAECPEVFMNFITSSYGEDMVPVIRAAFSMVLDPTAPWGKFIHVIGPSGSGKGAMLRLLQRIFGKNAIGTSTFEEISSPDKRHQNLKNCDLYVIGDISGYIKGIETFYDLVDNAPMTGRALQSSDAYSRQWDIRFALASVEYLQLENTAGGWDRRVLPILSQRRPEGTDIPNLENQLEANLSGIISWALSMDKAERNAILKRPWEASERISNAMHESKIHGDSVASFVDSCLRPVPYGTRTVEVTVEKGTLHDWYVAYCRANHLTPKGSARFLGHLKTIIPKHFEARRRYTAEETAEREPNGKLKRRPSRWVWLEVIPGIFDATKDPDGFTQSGFICRKNACQEGLLEQFDHWEPVKQSHYENDDNAKTGDQGDRGGPGTGPGLKPLVNIGDQGDQGDQGKNAVKSEDPNFEEF